MLKVDIPSIVVILLEQVGRIAKKVGNLLGNNEKQNAVLIRVNTLNGPANGYVDVTGQVSFIRRLRYFSGFV